MFSLVLPKEAASRAKLSMRNNNHLGVYITVPANATVKVYGSHDNGEHWIETVISNETNEVKEEITMSGNYSMITNYQWISFQCTSDAAENGQIKGSRKTVPNMSVTSAPGAEEVAVHVKHNLSDFDILWSNNDYGSASDKLNWARSEAEDGSEAYRAIKPLIFNFRYDFILVSQIELEDGKIQRWGLETEEGFHGFESDGAGTIIIKSPLFADEDVKTWGAGELDEEFPQYAINICHHGELQFGAVNDECEFKKYKEQALTDVLLKQFRPYVYCSAAPNSKINTAVYCAQKKEKVIEEESDRSIQSTVSGSYMIPADTTEHVCLLCLPSASGIAQLVNFAAFSDGNVKFQLSLLKPTADVTVPLTDVAQGAIKKSDRNVDISNFERLTLFDLYTNHNCNQLTLPYSEINKLVPSASLGYKFMDTATASNPQPIFLGVKIVNLDLSENNTAFSITLRSCK